MGIRLKIVHIITRLLRAGSEENTLISCLSQVKSGHKVYVIHGNDYLSSYYTELPCIEFIEASNLIHSLSLVYDLRGYYELRSLLREIGPDIVHTHQSKAGVIGRLAARSAGVPVVINGIHIVPFANVGPVRKTIYLGAERLANRVTDFHIDVSEGVRRAYLDEGIGTERTHAVIHSGFDLEKFQTASPIEWQSLDALAGLGRKPPIIVMVAAFEPRKRHAEFLAAVPQLIAAVPSVQVLFLGAGPQEESIRAAIRAASLERSVHMLGYRTDPERIIALADVCCLVSEREGLPRVLMQYLAAGKPCVACHLPGIEEVLRDDANGIVLPSQDVAGAAGAIVRLLRDPVLYTRLAEGARNTDLESWRADAMCAGILRIYHSLIDAKASRTPGGQAG